MTANWRQARPINKFGRRVSRALGPGFLIRKAWIFDNECDWVTRLKSPDVRREAHGWVKDFKHV
jgi:hypothetical protein